MPTYNLEAPNGKTYHIEGPEGASREEVIQAILARDPGAAVEPTVLGYAKEAIKGIPRGFMSGLEQAATGAAALLPEEYEKPVVAKAQELAERFSPKVAPGYEDAITTKLGEGLGSMGTFIVPGGLPARTLMAGAMGAGEARQRAQQAGATPEQISEATAQGILPGLTDIVPVERLINGLGKTVIKGFTTRLVRMAETGGLEGAQEMAQNIGQNLIAQGYNPEQGTFTGTGEAGAYGAGVGAIAQGLMDLAFGRRAPSTRNRVDQSNAPIEAIPQAPIEAIPQAPVEAIKETALQDGVAAGMEAIKDTTPAAPVTTLAAPVTTLAAPVVAAAAPKITNPVVQVQVDALQAQFDKREAEIADMQSRFKTLSPKDRAYLKNKIKSNAKLKAEIAALKTAPAVPVVKTEEAAAAPAAVVKTKVAAPVVKEEEAVVAGGISAEDALKARTAQLEANKNAAIQKGIADANAQQLVTDPLAKRAGVFVQPPAPKGGTSVVADGTRVANNLGAADNTPKGKVEEQVALVTPPVVKRKINKAKLETAAAKAVVAEEKLAAKKLADEAAARVAADKEKAAKAAAAKKLADKELADKEKAAKAAVAKELAKKKKADKAATVVPEEEDKVAQTDEDISFAALDTETDHKKYIAHVAILLETESGRKRLATVTEGTTKERMYTVSKNDIAEATAINDKRKGRNKVATERDVVTRHEDVKDRLSDLYTDYQNAVADEDVDVQNSINEDIKKAEAERKDIVAEAKEQGVGLKGKKVPYVGKSTGKQKRFSLGEEAAARTDHTAKEVADTLRKEFGDTSGFDKLVTVHQTESDLLAAYPEIAAHRDYYPGVRGVAHRGKVHLVADRIERGQELGVFLHEAGAHIGFDRLEKEGKLDRKFLVDQVYKWAQGNDRKAEIAKVALAKGINNDEIIAYTVEGLVDSGVTPTGFRLESTWLRKIMAAFQTLLTKLGMRHDITPQELVDLAAGAAHLAVEAGVVQSTSMGINRDGSQNLGAGDPVEVISDGRTGTVTKARYRVTNSMSSISIRLPSGEIIQERPSNVVKTRPVPRFSQSNPALAAGMGTAQQLFKGLSAPMGIIDSAVKTASGLRQGMANKLEWWTDKATRVYGNLATDATGEASMRDRIEAASKVTHIALSKLMLGGLRKEKGFWEAYKTDHSYQDILNKLEEGVGKYAETPDFESMNKAFNMAATARREFELIKDKQMTWQGGEVNPTLDVGTQAKGITPQMDAGMRIYNEVPEIKEALAIFEKFNNDGVDQLAKAGVIDQKTADMLKGTTGYVPWFREADDAEGNIKLNALSPSQFTRGLINKSNLRELEGRSAEDAQISNVLNNMAKLSGWMTSKTIGNDTAAYMVDFATKFGVAGKPFAKKVGMGQPNSVLVLENGVPKYYAFDDPMALPAFRGYESAHSAITQFLSAPANLVRAGVTAFPVFSVSQLPQDAMRAFIDSDLKNPYALIPRILKNFVVELVGGGTESGKTLSKFGIVGRGGDIMPGEATRSLRRRLGHYDTGMGGTARKFWDKLEKLQAASDAASRTALYELTMEETKSKAFPDGNQALAIRKAREIINFDTQGSSGYSTFLRQTVPFMGVSMIALNNLYKGMVLGQRLSDKEASAARRSIIYHGTQIAVLTMLYTMLVGDTDDYKKLSDSERNRNFIIPGTGLSIPVPGDGLGFIFKVIPEQIARYTLAEGLESKDAGSKAGRALYKGFTNLGSFESYIPVVGSPLPKTFVELVLNENWYTGNAIVGKSKENLAPSQQYTDSTSEIAKQLGKALNLSPLKLDYVVRAMTGQLGGFTLAMGEAAVNAAQGKVTPSWDIRTFPGMSAFTYPDGKDRAALEDFYELRERVDVVARTYTDLAKAGKGREALAYLAEGDNKRAYALRQFQTEAEKGLAKFRTARSLLINDPNIKTGEEMKQRLKELDDRENAYLKSMRLPDKREFAHLTPTFDLNILKAFR